MDKLVIHTWEKIGKQADGYGFCPFDDLLENWLRFEANSWTKYDDTVASMMAIVAWEVPKVAPRVRSKPLPRRRYSK
jgi:hypothetical protein